MRSIYPPQGTGAVPVTLSGENIDTDLNTLIHNNMTVDYMIYIVGSTVKAKNMKTGIVDYSGNNSPGSDPTIQSAINNLSGVGGTIVFSNQLFLINNFLTLPQGNNTNINQFKFLGNYGAL